MVIRPPFRPIRPDGYKPNRYLKIASAKNPSVDFIELNDFEGFLCTSFQSLGINRKFEFLEISNRQFIVDNKPSFKKYSLTIEILTKYSEYEQKYKELITFLDRNKKDGFRLYFRPYKDMETRYCLCNIEMSSKTEKLQPVILTLAQNSLWFGEVKKAETTQVDENSGSNLFAFSAKDIDGENYFSTSFEYEEDIDEYCIRFFNGIENIASIVNNSYNDIPLNIRIYGRCTNPEIFLYKAGENEPIRKAKIIVTIPKGYYIEIKADIIDNGVWLVNASTGEKQSYDEKVDNSVGSPYIFIGNGEYTITVRNDSEEEKDGDYRADIFYQEEYSE
jgi:hypothetical protein